MKKIFLPALLSLVSLAAFADDISLGQPIYNGNGCPAGTASATLSPDNKALTILFDQYVANAGGATRKIFDRKTCNIGVPVHVPSGMTVSVIKIDYRGFNSIPVGGYSQFNVEYFFAGSRGIRAEKVFYGPMADNYTIGNEILGQTVVWSPCGQDVIVRANTSMFVRTTPGYLEAMATVDSIDVEAGIKYHLQWQRC